MCSRSQWLLSFLLTPVSLYPWCSSPQLAVCSLLCWVVLSAMLLPLIYQVLQLVCLSVLTSLSYFSQWTHVGFASSEDLLSPLMLVIPVAPQQLSQTSSLLQPSCLQAFLWFPARSGGSDGGITFQLWGCQGWWAGREGEGRKAGPCLHTEITSFHWSFKKQKWVELNSAVDSGMPYASLNWGCSSSLFEHRYKPRLLCCMQNLL